MVESVQDLKRSLRGIKSDLLICSGRPEDVLPKLLPADSVVITQVICAPGGRKGCAGAVLGSAAGRQRLGNEGRGIAKGRPPSHCPGEWPIGNGRALEWHNTSVPEYAAVFEGPTPPFQTSLSALVA